MTSGKNDEADKAAAPIKRNAAATRKRIMNSARESFARRGFRGARIEEIAEGAKANVQMIYRYFGKKESLYLEVLEDTYMRIRASERRLRISELAPDEGMRKLIEFTYDYLAANPEFVAIIRNENMDNGRFARQAAAVSDSTTPLMEMLTNLLKRGHDKGVFRGGIDPTQLYVTILSLCITHLAQRDTLSVMFQRDLGAADWLAERRIHAVEVIMCYIHCPRADA